MIFVDSNVFIYHVGGEHPLRERARAFVARSIAERARLATSAEVLQELLHVYLRVGRTATLDAAFALVAGCVDEVWPVEVEDVELARELAGTHPHLEARDLIHFACCRRREAERLVTFDRALDAAWERRG